MPSGSLPFVEVSGSPRERGRQYGEAARDRVAAGIEFYAAAFGEATGMTWAGVTELAGRWEEPARGFAPDLMEEMAGIAEGAGVTPREVLALNGRGEILYEAAASGGDTDGAASAAEDLERPEGCTSFAALPEASGDGHVYCGQNWDWRDGVKDTLVVLRVVQPPKPTIIMHVEAGQVGRQGANSAGIALNANGLGGRFGGGIGVPQTLIRRRVLDADRLDHALEAVLRSRAQIASNALITHRRGFAIDLETTPGAHGWLYPDDGLLVHGNHFASFVPPAIAATHRPMSADSLYRVPRVRDGLKPLRDSGDPEKSRELIRAAFSDHLGYPESVCTHPDEGRPAVRRWATLISSCVDLTTGDYDLAAGTPCDHPYVRAPWNLYDGPGEKGPQ